MTAMKRVVAGLAALCVSSSGEAASGPFAALIGSWGGSGSYTLQDGTSEKLRCNAYYTGGSNQLHIAVRCSGEQNKIEIRSTLTASGTALSGNWEERTYNAEGTVSGRHADNKISLNVSGSISGSMNIQYTASRQTVTITLQGIPLKTVSVSLSRR
jgi:hypothetical protein